MSAKPLEEQINDLQQQIKAQEILLDAHNEAAEQVKDRLLPVLADVQNEEKKLAETNDDWARQALAEAIARRKEESHELSAEHNKHLEAVLNLTKAGLKLKQELGALQRAFWAAKRQAAETDTETRDEQATGSVFTAVWKWLTA